jgi:hypothetical protein
MKFSPEDIVALRAASVHLVTCSSFDEMNPSTRECNCNGFLLKVRVTNQMEAANKESQP